MRTIDMKRLKDALGFTVTYRVWGNRRKADMGKVATDSDKSRLRLSKELINAEEYEAIKSFCGAERAWVYSQTVPSYFKEGFQLTSLAGVEVIEKRMKQAEIELAALVDKLLKVYPEKIAEAQIALNGQFNPFDYPMTEDLRRAFGISWNWIAFTVPEGLPPELRAIEQAKMEAQFEDAGQQITEALRLGFQELVANAADRLKSEPGEKPKVFRDTLIGNIQEFIGTFNQRNLLGDVELAGLVAKAKDILVGVNANLLRQDGSTRDKIQQQFADINATLATMVTTKSTRKFDLE